MTTPALPLVRRTVFLAPSLPRSLDPNLASLAPDHNQPL